MTISKIRGFVIKKIALFTLDHKFVSIYTIRKANQYTQEKALRHV